MKPKTAKDWADEMDRAASVVESMGDVDLKQCADGNREVASLLRDLAEAVALLRVYSRVFPLCGDPRIAALLANHPEQQP